MVGYSGNMGRVHEFETILGAVALLQEELPPHSSPLPIRGEGIQIPAPVSLGGEGKATSDEAQAIVFLFIGGGHYRPWLEQEAGRRGLDNMRFKLYQPREQLRASLNVPDVHLISLLPAMEGLIVPSKCYGILAAGRPVLFIGDPQGELGRLIHQADCGTAVGVGESQALAEQM